MPQLYPVVMTSDLHLTDHAKDEYRWSVFDRIARIAIAHKASTVLILGDLTDAKDNHSARLVNRIVKEIDTLADMDMRVLILRGNHDYMVKEHPFFAFLSSLSGVFFINEPTQLEDWVLIPHSRELPLPGLEMVNKKTRHCFMHQTVTGAIASNGQEMEGELRSSRLPFSDTCKYYSGDIHVPQICGPVEYVGSPYPVQFGDTFTPRILVLINDYTREEYEWEGVQRLSVKIATPKALLDLDLRKGDQIKVRLALSRTDMANWQEIKREVVKRCKALGVQLVSIELLRPRVRVQLTDGDSITTQAHLTATPEDVLDRYCRSRGIEDETADVGFSLLKDHHAPEAHRD